MTQKYIKTTLKQWIKNHPDCWHENEFNDTPFWYVQNALGALLKYPKWYQEFIMKISGDKKEINENGIEYCINNMGFRFRNLIQHSNGKWSCKLLHKFGGRDEFWGETLMEAIKSASDFLNQFEDDD